MRGFTLIEIFLVILVVLILLGSILPIGFNFYKSQQLQIHTYQILQTLRRAQSKAMSVELDSNFGIYIANGNYTLFKGNSLNEVGRNLQYDEIFDLPQVITVSGLSEVVFLKPEGKPSPSTGTITINSDEFTQTITINAVGRINLEL